MKFKKGDLVHAPSGVYLYRFRESGDIQTYMKLEKPRNLLLTEAGSDPKILSVIYENQHWTVLAKDVYEISG
tara:strand:- start:3429 stop:3644 length:216 start_codon:yes stop_codon:yes gene_type:complete